jgi:hypothetical protein
MRSIYAMACAGHGGARHRHLVDCATRPCTAAASHGAVTGHRPRWCVFGLARCQAPASAVSLTSGRARGAARPPHCMGAGTLRSLRDNRDQSKTENFTVTFDAKMLIVHTRVGDMLYDVLQVSRAEVSVFYGETEKVDGKEWNVTQSGQLKSENGGRASLSLRQMAFSKDGADARAMIISGNCVENNGR